MGVRAFLITISELVGAITVIITALIAIEKWTKGRFTKWILKPVLDDIASIKAKIHQMELDNLKLVIMSEEMPLEERINAGERYIEQRWERRS